MDRLASLSARHSGRERYEVTDRLEARVLARTTQHKPADGSTHWYTRKLAAELGDGISHMTVARIWAKHGIKPHRLEGYLASNDPDFEAKAADVIGLYLSPQFSAWMRKPRFKRWITRILYCPCRRGVQSAMALNTYGTARCRCMRPLTPRPVRCWARLRFAIRHRNS